jgi:methionyl-tRNA formyltransferase
MSNLTFFGSSKFSVFCLDELKTLGILPKLIITTPDQPTGRGLKLTPTPVKVWAEENKIDCLTPAKLDLKIAGDIFLVASYGKIIPKTILDLPKHGTLNIHPSLLPKYRGPSPLQEQILNDEHDVGVTLMLIDEKMDHGPIIAQERITITKWPDLENFKKLTAKVGAKLFADNLNNWLSGKIKASEQVHNQATFTKKVEKVDGLIDIETGDPYLNFCKIQAYSMWPQAYFFVKNKNGEEIRVIVKEAEFSNNTLVIRKVLPAGKKEMNYEDFLRGLR